jgi:hypothetical protein
MIAEADTKRGRIRANRCTSRFKHHNTAERL